MDKIILYNYRNYDIRLTDGQWSKSKPSVFYTARADGFMDCWDILQQKKDPILSIKVYEDRDIEESTENAIYYSCFLLFRCQTRG